MGPMGWMRSFRMMIIIDDLSWNSEHEIKHPHSMVPNSFFNPSKKQGLDWVVFNRGQGMNGDLIGVGEKSGYSWNIWQMDSGAPYFQPRPRLFWWITSRWNFPYIPTMSHWKSHSKKVGIKKTTSHVTPQQRLSSHDLRIDISELVSSLGKSRKSMMFPYHMNFPRDLHRIQPWTRRGSAWLKQRPKTPFPSLAQPTTRNKNDDGGPGRDPAEVGIFLAKVMIYWWMVIIYYDYYELYDYTMII
jgi:hypothetical protein